MTETLHAAKAHLLDHRAATTALIDALSAFLALPCFSSPSLTVSAAPPVPVPAQPAAVKTPRRKVTRAPRKARTAAATRSRKASAPVAARPAGTSSPATADIDLVLAALRKESPLSPGELATRTNLLPLRCRRAIAALEHAGLVTVTGATANRKVTLSGTGRTVTPAPSGQTSPAAIGVAIDAAVLKRVAEGRATFDELLQVLPADAGADAQAKREALNRSLRRLSLKRAVVDVGAHWQAAS